MNSITLVIFGFIVFFLGYRFYSKWLSKRIFDLHEKIITPAHEFRDDVDFLPTKKHILFGHHYTSIAGAAPIIGPCIAAFWGWLPAILWVVLGTVFMGAVHDFGALVISVKEKGKSVADISVKILNGRVRILFLYFYHITYLAGISCICHGNCRSVCCNPNVGFTCEHRDNNRHHRWLVDLQKTNGSTHSFNNSIDFVIHFCLDRITNTTQF